MRANARPWRIRPLHLAAAAAILSFALLAGRFWHPYYGFTQFLQFDSSDEVLAIHEVRGQPIYFYAGNNGYDGFSYAEIAFHPLLDSPELQRALGNVPYRARRILGSALAWVLARGRPADIANVYAGLNLGVWLGFAWLLWRLLPVTDGRSWIAWAGLLFSAGALHSVRLALTDLPGVTLFAAAMLLWERKRVGSAYGALALAGLARETALSGVVAFWRGPWNSPRAWLGNAARALGVALPLIAWMIYVRWKAGAAPQGVGNFTWPVVGWIGKWSEILGGFRRQPDFIWLNATTLLATAALTVQAAYIIRWPEIDNTWWRAGAVGVATMACFGGSVWEGHPGAATRVLLPLSLAFAVLAVRRRAPLAWLLAGNLSVFSGVLALWNVPHDASELAAGRTAGLSYLVSLDEGWYGCEQGPRHQWAWTAGEGQLTLRTSPATAPFLQGRLGLRALSPRRVEIRQGGKLLWRGPVGPKLQWVELSGLASGQSELHFSTDRPGVPESGAPGARRLAFAVYDVQLE
jgi:hypothetical protein